jgi:hypothetical protein
MNHDPEVIKFVFDVLTTLFVFFISFLIIIYLIDKRKKYKEFKRVNEVCMLNGLPDINSIITETDRWDAIRSAEDKIMQENSYMLCRVYREYMSLLEKRSL